MLATELRRTRQLFEELTGERMQRYWRAPFGEVNGQILGWAEAEGWTHVGWTQGLDTLDWVADTESELYRSADEVRDRLLRQATGDGRARGGIVLMHLGTERTQDRVSKSLDEIIDGFRAEGYRLLTVSSLLGS